MKKIIRGKRYDTDTAKLVGEYWNEISPRDFGYLDEALYQKRTGEYFLHGQGGAMTKYAVSTGQNSWSGGEQIIPLSYEAAKEWAEERLSADEYEDIFGEVEEDETKKTVAYSLPVATIETVKREASERGIGLSEVIVLAVDALEEAESRKIYTAARETGDIIDEVASVEEGLALIAKYEEDDKKNGVYEEDFYDLVNRDHETIDR